jgi:nucleotide-binding universal stress UspA family protein
MSVRHILAPVDFSNLGGPALETACDLARRYGGTKVTLLHVYQMPNVMLPEGYILASPQELGAMFAHVKDELGKLTLRAHELGADAQAESVEGVPWVEIVRFAEKRAVDLIVMGTHGRTGISHAFIGSVAERVVRHAPCPVLVVRTPKGTAS